MGKGGWGKADGERRMGKGGRGKEEGDVVEATGRGGVRGVQDGVEGARKARSRREVRTSAREVGSGRNQESQGCVMGLLRGK